MQQCHRTLNQQAQSISRPSHRRSSGLEHFKRNVCQHTTNSASRAIFVARQHPSPPTLSASYLPCYCIPRARRANPLQMQNRGIFEIEAAGRCPLRARAASRSWWRGRTSAGRRKTLPASRGGSIKVSDPKDFFNVFYAALQHKTYLISFRIARMISCLQHSVRPCDGSPAGFKQLNLRCLSS